MHLRESVKKYDIRIQSKSYNFTEKEIIMLVFINIRLNKVRRNFLREREREEQEAFSQIKICYFHFQFWEFGNTSLYIYVKV